MADPSARPHRRGRLHALQATATAAAAATATATATATAGLAAAAEGVGRGQVCIAGTGLRRVLRHTRGQEIHEGAV